MEIHLLSVVVPVYKQEKTIYRDIRHLYATLKSTPYQFEILPVVDGTSLDKSLTEIKRLKKPEIRALGYKTNKGKGQAVRYGMKHAQGDVVTFIDAGMDIDHASIIMLLEHMKWYDADIIVGSKLHSASLIENYPLWRTKGFYYLVRLLFHLKIRDTQTGLKAYKREVIEAVLDRMVIKTFAFDVEILAVANYLGFKKIYDAPVRVQFDNENTGFHGRRLMSSIFRMSFDTFAIWYRMHILHYYDDGRNRVKKLDPELRLYINTGDMRGSKQNIIELVNRFFHITHIKRYSKNEIS